MNEIKQRGGGVGEQGVGDVQRKKRRPRMKSKEDRCIKDVYAKEARRECEVNGKAATESSQISRKKRAF